MFDTFSSSNNPIDASFNLTLTGLGGNLELNNTLAPDSMKLYDASSGVINIDTLEFSGFSTFTFSPQTLIDNIGIKGDLTNLIVGDYNGDGLDDFIRQEKGVWDDDDINTAHLYLSQGNGTFSSQPLTDNISMKGDLTNLIVGDYNGDGLDDFIRQEKGVWDDDDINTANVYLAKDWFSQNLSDPEIIKITREFAVDGELNRNDMIQIFRTTENFNEVSATELKDLQTIISNSSSFKMQDHVRVLSDKIANGSVANKYYQGNLLGNLKSGSSAEHMEKLINKWFLGLDRPSAPSGYSMEYKSASGSLFGNDRKFSYKDITQGYLGDCYFLASLGATAHQRPSAIQNMFIDNGDGTFTVRLFGEKEGKVTTVADYVTVDKYLPTNVSGYDKKGNPFSGEQFANYDNADVGLWVALAEKAYAQFSESNVTDRKYTTNSYGNIENGLGYQAMPSISGENGVFYANEDNNAQGDFLSLQEISEKIASGKAMTGGTTDSSKLNITPDHEYAIIGVNVLKETLTLFNPWGNNDDKSEEPKGIRTISYNDFQDNFDMISVA